ncbi:hypothetical protein [Clostridium aciditolerans]|uniref:Uncharacterized protein n=1 Tax=Clostridium aciditolerans TaxID=339861 RepID=A0A934M408_9CLOT|nr:hypothetical protein [Clostridium aciditolerans]MBI6873600.1 hypothetical protein [Clostridium aciditolerans]
MNPLIAEIDYMKNAHMIFTSGKKSAYNNKCIDIGCMKIDEYLYIVNGYGSCNAWGEKDKALKMESVDMKVLDIREDGINKYGCATIGNSNITCWVGKEDVIYYK